MVDQIIDDYKSFLGDLTYNSKPRIDQLTMIAEDEKTSHAGPIVRVIEQHLQQVQPTHMLPVMYLIDSIIKNIQQGSYQELFAKNLVKTFCGVFEKVDEKTKQAMFKLRQTWPAIFSNSKLFALDSAVQQLDPAWPVTSTPPDAKPKDIHVDPKFLKQKQDEQAARQKKAAEEESNKLAAAEDDKRKREMEAHALTQHLPHIFRPNFQPEVYIKDIECKLLKDQIQQNDKRISPCTYESQKILAAKIIQRIRLMLKHHKGKLLEDFKYFDFQVYTSRNKTLREQTRSRLANPGSGCIPPNDYNSASDIHKYTETRVHLYQNCIKENKRHEDLLKDAEVNPDKLFLIIADEAHWGITCSGDGSIKAHEKLINTWDADKYKNVIVLMVTATAYNLLTNDTRLPLDVFCAESLKTGELLVVESTQDEKVERLVNQNGEDITNLVGPKKPLHHVQWTEIYSGKLEQGLEMTIRSLVTSSASGFSRPIYLGPQQDCKFVLFAGTECLKGDLADLALIVKGKNDKVQIFDIYQRQLVVRRSEGDGGYTVCFTSKIDSDCNPDFEMVMTYGEDVFSLHPIMAKCKEKLSLYYDETSKTVKVHEKPKAVVLGNHEVIIDLPVTDLFFIETLKDMESPGGNSYRYLSLNYYYNTIWKQNLEDRKIRCDESFEELCQTMLQESETRKNVHGQTDVFVSEYCIFILALSEFDKLLPSNDATHLSVEDMMKKIKQATEKIWKKLDSFRKELKDKKYDSDENFIPEKAIGDVLDLYQSSIDDSSKDCDGFWKSTLKSCLFGRVEEISKRMEKVSDYSDVEIQDIRNLKRSIINSHETGKIISDVMKMTVDSAGHLQGHMKVIRLQNITNAKKFHKSLEKARDIAYADSQYLFEIVPDYGPDNLQKIYTGKTCKQNYKLHLLLQRQRCANNDKEMLCLCKDYVSKDPSVKCAKCDHYHNPVAIFEDLEGLPCILILVDKGKMGDTFPPTFNCMDLRIRCTDRKMTGSKGKTDYVLSSMVQELGRLCRYNKAGDHHNVPYALVPKDMMQFLQSETVFTDATADGRATIYSGFLRDSSKSSKIDRYAKKENNPLRNDGADNKVTRIDFNAADTNFDKVRGSGSQEGKLNPRTNMILLDAEPQCGKTGTYCCVIAKLRKLICEEVDPCDIDSETGSETESEPESDIEVDDYDDEARWSYPYHDQMAREKMNPTVSSKNKYTRLHGPWRPGIGPDKRPKFPDRGDVPQPENLTGAITCQAPYKSEIHSHECSACIKQEQPRQTIVKVDLKDFGYQGKLFLYNPDRGPQLVARLRSANVECNPKIPQTSAEQKQTDLKTWIFIPTSNRALSACLDLNHTMKGPRAPDDDTEDFKTYTQILVVKEEEFDDYCEIWGPKVTAILQLPSKMKDDTGKDVSAIDGGVGFSRRFIQIFAQQLKLDVIFMLDDNVWFIQEVQFKDGKVSRLKGKASFECVPLYKVLSHMESLFDVSTPTPETSFKPYQDEGSPLSDLEKYTGPRHKYALLGVLKARMGSHYVKSAFKKRRVSSLLLINLKSVSEKNIQFKLWEVFEDLDFAEKANAHDLWVCKFNRFLQFKKRVKMMPIVYLWNDDTELTAMDGPPAENEVKFLKNWIEHYISPKEKQWIGKGNVNNEHLQDLFGKLKMKRHCKNVYFFCVFEPLQTAPEEALYNILKLFMTDKAQQGMTDKAQQGICHFCIAIPVATCLRFSVKKVDDFKRLFAKIFEEGFELHVVTSHRLTHFQVEIITISVLGKVTGTSADDDMEVDV